MKSIFISICILFAGASIGAAQTEFKPLPLDKCVKRSGFDFLICDSETPLAERLEDRAITKRNRYINELNEMIMIPKGGLSLGFGLKSEWLMTTFANIETLDQLVLLRQQLQDANSKTSAIFASKKTDLSPLGFKGGIILIESEDCLVMPFADRRKAHIEKCQEIDFSAPDEK